jgi:hypothetical protein
MITCTVNTRDLLPVLPAGTQFFAIGPTSSDHSEYDSLILNCVTRSTPNSGWCIGCHPITGIHFLDQEVNVSRAGVICLQDQDEDWYILRLFDPWETVHSQNEVRALLLKKEYPLLCGRIPVDDADAIENIQELEEARFIKRG